MASLYKKRQMMQRCQERSTAREAAVLERIKEEDALAEAARYRPSEEELEKKEIHHLKTRMVRMDRLRAQKQVVVNKDNAFRIERDEVRHARFMAEYETPEQKRLREIEEKVAEIKKMMAQAELDEDEDRDALEQEQVLEFKVFNHMHHLDVFGMTVSLVTEEFNKKERATQVAFENRERQDRSNRLVLGGLEREETEARHSVSRGETFESRQLSQKWKESWKIARDQELTRFAEEHQLLEDLDRKDEEERRQAADRAVQDVEDEVEARIARITEKFKEDPIKRVSSAIARNMALNTTVETETYAAGGDNRRGSRESAHARRSSGRLSDDELFALHPPGLLSVPHGTGGGERRNSHPSGANSSFGVSEEGPPRGGNSQVFTAVPDGSFSPNLKHLQQQTSGGATTNHFASSFATNDSAPSSTTNKSSSLSTAASHGSKKLTRLSKEALEGNEELLKKNQLEARKRKPQEHGEHLSSSRMQPPMLSSKAPHQPFVESSDHEVSIAAPTLSPPNDFLLTQQPEESPEVSPGARAGGIVLPPPALGHKSVGEESPTPTPTKKSGAKRRVSLSEEPPTMTGVDGGGDGDHQHGSPIDAMKNKRKKMKSPPPGGDGLAVKSANRDNSRSPAAIALSSPQEQQGLYDEVDFGGQQHGGGASSNRNNTTTVVSSTAGGGARAVRHLNHVTVG